MNDHLATLRELAELQRLNRVAMSEDEEWETEIDFEIAAAKANFDAIADELERGQKAIGFCERLRQDSIDIGETPPPKPVPPKIVVFREGTNPND